jgi:hypothetical protein
MQYNSILGMERFHINRHTTVLGMNSTSMRKEKVKAIGYNGGDQTSS